MSLAKKNILFGLLFTAFTTPSIFFMMGLPMILQMRGFDASFIGLFQMVGFSAVLKFLLSPPIDRIVFKKNHYKTWICLLGIVYALLLIGLGECSLEHQTSLVFMMICLIVFVATLIDIPLNALAIKVFKKEERIAAGSYKMSAVFTALLLGGGILLLFYNHIGWQYTLWFMAGLIFIALLFLKCITENDEKILIESFSFRIISSFFKQKNIGIWLIIVAFYFAFISAVWIFIKPYLLSKKMNPDNVALLVGIYGGIIGILGGFLASYIGKYYAKKRLLVVFSCFNALSVAILVYMEYCGFSMGLVVVAISLTALAISFSSAIIFALMMDYARQTSKAIDYALQSSLFSFTRIASAMGAGIIVSTQNYGIFFIVELVCILIVTYIVIKKYPST
ncbi:MAG: MFS transporter [Campylobacterales bacterium]|nr:MFS transporter [Campylobacterales bacterium]MBN2832480.1 MFS transporter [Campylobacterales bacterium]